MRKDQTPLWLPERHSQVILKICPSSLDASQTHVLSPMRSPIGVQQVARNTVTHLQWATKVLKHSVVKLSFWAFRSVRLGLPSTLIRHENAALFLRLGLSSTPIRHENEALFLRLGLPSTLIRHENVALFLRLGLPSTPIRHENAAFFSTVRPTVHTNPSRKRSSNSTVRPTVHTNPSRKMCLCSEFAFFSPQVLSSRDFTSHLGI